MCVSKLREKVNDAIPITCKKEEKLDRILSILESHRESTLNGLPDSIKNTAKAPDPKTHFGKIKQKNTDHDCAKSSACNPAWDKFGCIEVYKLSFVLGFSICQLIKAAVNPPLMSRIALVKGGA